MKIDEITGKLRKEREFGSRFPARVILAENLDAYSELEKQLKGLCDVTLNVAEFCRSSDTVPRFDRLQDKLKEYEGKQVLLLSVGEYLRLCVKREVNPDRRQFLSFWETQQSESSMTRVVMPMFSCRDVFERAVGSVDERQKDCVWALDAQRSSAIYNVAVYSTSFKNAVQPSVDCLSAWLRNWQALLRENATCSIMTMLESNVEPSFGTVSIKLINRPFEYVTENLADGGALVEKWENDDFWKSLVEHIFKLDKKVSFDQLVFRTLNIDRFDFVRIAANWKNINAFDKKLVRLWYKVHPSDDYFSYACNRATSAEDIPERIRDEILFVSSKSEEWIQQRMKALKGFRFSSFDESFFAALDKEPMAETKLKLLTYQTHEEKTYAVRIASGLLRDGAEPTAVADMLENGYPALSVYLRAETGRDEAVDKYMTWYRTNKIINRYPGEYSAPISFDRFDSRFKLLSQMSDKDCVFFWIDGFGVEYAPLFLHELKENSRGSDLDSVSIGTSVLPTETEYNRQWDTQDPNTSKWDKLDALSHKGSPDDKSYFSCIARQLDVISEAVKRVKKYLETHEYVVITGDHGSSRFAALAFHDSGVVPILAPNKSIVRCLGRFCELDEKSADMIELPGTKKVSTDGKTFLVMNDYRHFSTSGNAAGGNTDDHDVAGETHGGNTVEERLVPVIVVKSNVYLKCKPTSATVTRMNGRIDTVLSFNRPVTGLNVSMGKVVAACEQIDDKNWQISLCDVTTDEISLVVRANGKQLPDVKLKVKKQGIIRNKDPFDL